MTAVAADRLAESSPRTIARVTGLLFLITIVTGIVAQGFISGGLIVFGNPAGTATNILAHGRLYHAGFTLYLVEMSAQVATTVLFYQLLRPVSRGVALLALVFGLVGCTI